jgi:thiamine pyrophosphate-dependent acetolactate synthase large subunit-like protein
MNDGAYSAEAHKFRGKGMDPSETVLGRPDFAGLARAFGIEGEKVRESGRFGELFEAYRGGSQAAVWDIDIDEKIPSAMFRRLHYGEIG